MSVALNFNYLSDSLHDDLKEVVRLLGTEPDLPVTGDTWDNALNILKRVHDVCQAAQIADLLGVAKRLLSQADKLRNNQLPDPYESAERLLAAMIVMAEQLLSPARVASHNGHWLQEIHTALNTKVAGDTPSKTLQLAGEAYAPVIQSALLALHQGKNISQALNATAGSYGRLAKAANEGPGLLQHLAALADCMKLGLVADDRKALQTLSLGASLLRKRLNNKRDGEAESKLRDRCVVQLSTVVDTGVSHWLGVLREVESTQHPVATFTVWQPQKPLVPMASSLTGLTDGLREELSYVIEALDVNSRVAVGAGQDTIMLSQRVTHCANILQAAGVANWAAELHKQSDAVLRAATRTHCMNAAERIEDLVARLEPAVFETWLTRQEGEHHLESSKMVVAGVAKIAVVDSSISSLNRFTARLELIATDATRDGSHVSKASLDELRGAATVMRWNELLHILDWIDRYLGDAQSMRHGQQLSELISIVVNASTVVIQHLHGLRTTPADLEKTTSTLSESMKKLVPEYSGSD